MQILCRIYVTIMCETGLASSEVRLMIDALQATYRKAGNEFKSEQMEYSEHKERHERKFFWCFFSTTSSTPLFSRHDSVFSVFSRCFLGNTLTFLPPNSIVLDLEEVSELSKL